MHKIVLRVVALLLCAVGADAMAQTFTFPIGDDGPPPVTFPIGGVCETFVEPMPIEVGGGSTSIHVCCNELGNCTDECTDSPAFGDPACPNDPPSSGPGSGPGGPGGQMTRPVFVGTFGGLVRAAVAVAPLKPK